MVTSPFFIFIFFTPETPQWRQIPTVAPGQRRPTAPLAAQQSWAVAWSCTALHLGFGRVREQLCVPLPPGQPPCPPAPERSLQHPWGLRVSPLALRFASSSVGTASNLRADPVGRTDPVKSKCKECKAPNSSLLGWSRNVVG